MFADPQLLTGVVPAVDNVRRSMFARTGWLYPLVIVAVLAAASVLRLWDPLFLQTLRALGSDVFQRLEPAPVNPNPPVRVIAIEGNSVIVEETTET